jgi:ferredoxin-nitrite reductase
MVLLSQVRTCPGLFYATTAQDGILSRIRIPGGIINSQQCRAIANIADDWGKGYIDITNRANLQIRQIEVKLNSQVLRSLQELGLASSNPAVDHIRNIMTSPTAGIDPQELLDTRPLVTAWNNYLTENSHLGELSPKFSIGFDGGGKVGVSVAESGRSHRANDITFAAVAVDDQLAKSHVGFSVYLQAGEKGERSQDTGILLPPDSCLPVLAALADVYLEHSTNSQRQPRLREVIQSVGLTHFLSQVGEKVSLCYKNLTPKTLTRPTRQNESYLMGIHPQRQTGLFYIGVIVPLGRLTSSQMRGLANLIARYSRHNLPTLRLTPGQNLLLTDIPETEIKHVQTEINNLGLSICDRDIRSGLVACSGKHGCAAGLTDTQDHARQLTEYLTKRIILDSPINIHFTGCAKSCAQLHQADITLLGVNNQRTESYDVYIGRGNTSGFGSLLYENVVFEELPGLITQILQVYQINRQSSDQSFPEFMRHHPTQFRNHHD